ncbi:APC family permease [soil metagenome]
MKGPSTPPTAESNDLRRSVGFAGVLGQSIAGVAPTTTPTINVMLVFAVAGSGSWFAYLIATLAVLLVASNLIPLSRRFSSAGSLSELVEHGLGKHGRLATAWSLLLAYLTVSVATVGACVNYLSVLSGWAGFALPTLCWVALVAALAATLAWRDIRVSTGLMLTLECISVTLVFLLGLRIMIRQGITVDYSQLQLGGLTPSGMGQALLIGVLSFVGFEAASTLGDEARKPLRDIPRALILTPLLAGVFFIYSSYVIVMGFTQYKIPVASSKDPLDLLAKAVNLPGLGILVAVGAAISLFGCVIATMVASSRLAFSLAHQGALPATLARLGGSHSAPQRALALCIGVIIVLALALASLIQPLDIYDLMGTFGTFGCIAAYALTCIASPIFLHRNGCLKAYHVILSGLALAVLGYVLFASVYPFPTWPSNLLPSLFLALLAVGFAYSSLLPRKPSA